jgi:hypothetical protein
MIECIQVKLLPASPVQLFALDLSCDRIYVSTWPEFLPLVKQLLSTATYVNLAGNYLQPLFSEQLRLGEVLNPKHAYSARRPTSLHVAHQHFITVCILNRS